MRRNLQDRSEFFPGPARKSPDRESERLRELIDTTTPPVSSGGTGGTSFEVSGLVPEFTGVPAGLQQFYVAPVVVDDTINMSSTVLLEDGLGSLPFVQDTYNDFGLGTASLVGKLDGASGGVIYNFASGSASSFTSSIVSTLVGGFRVGPNFAVSTTSNLSGTSGADVLLVQDGVISEVSLEPPPAASYFVAAGVSSDGTKICAVWKSNPSYSYCYVAIHDLDGTFISVSPTYTNDTGTTRQVIVENGYVVLFTSGSFSQRVYVAPANNDAGFAWTLMSTTSVSSKQDATVNVTSDGYVFFRQSGTDALVRLNVTNGILSSFPDVFVRYDDGVPPSVSADISNRYMYGVDANTVLCGGIIHYLVEDVYYPVYSAVVLDGVGANVSDSVFTEYGNGIGVYAITFTSGGNVVYAIDTGYPDYDRFLVKVTGP